MSGLYLHVPFCRRKCGYCAFASRPPREDGEIARYLDAVGKEARLRAASLATTTFETLYVGGGSPSLLPPEALAALVATLRDVAGGFAPDAELTLEANPEGVTPAALDRWRAAGFNRLSLGAQSFDPAALAFLERAHAPRQLEEAVRTARAAGFTNLNLDLIVGLPAPHEGRWEEDLARALALAPEHLSVYLLTVEPPSRLHEAVAQGRVPCPDEDRQADTFLAIHERLAAAGFEHYEVSNYARPGRRSRHNEACWAGAPYLGFGPAAHSFEREGDTSWRRANLPAAEAYAAALDRGERPLDFEEALTEEMAARERIMLALRTRDGLDAAAFGAAAAPLCASLDAYAHEGLLDTEGSRYRPTPAGLLRADGMAVALWEALPAPAKP